MWWGGASLLAAGNVVIGQREEGANPGGSVELDEPRGGAGEAEGLLGRSGSRSGGKVKLDEANEGELRGRSNEEHGRLMRGEEIDDPI
jgi:hypothetical protein